MPEKIALGTAANHYLSSYFHLANQHGFDAEQMLRASGLGMEIVDAPSQRVDAEKLAFFLLSMWECMQDESTGLSASPIPRGAFYMMGKLTIHEANLRKAIHQASRLYALVTNAFTLDLIEDDELVLFRSTMHSPERDPDHLFAEINLMAWHRYFSWLIAENLPLERVYFSYESPSHVSEYSYLFPGQHVFGADAMGFSFHKKYLDRECVQSRAALKTFMHECPMLLFLQPKTDFSLTGPVYRLLRKNRNEGYPSIHQVAEHLHMTTRTLTRKLQAEGNSYQKIKDQIRHDRAVIYLTRHTLSISEVAEKLEYSDSSVFARAFRAWTGYTPTEYRLKHPQSDTDI